MSTLESGTKGYVPVDTLKLILTLYKSIGSSEKCFISLNKNCNYYIEKTKDQDIYFCFKTFFSSTKLSDERINTIIKKNITTLKNKDEIILNNLKEIFHKINYNSSLFLSVAELHDLNGIIYKNINPRNSLLKKGYIGEKTYLEELSSLIDNFNKLIKNDTCDYLYLLSALVVDLSKLSPFETNNNLIIFIVYYALLRNSDIKCFGYVSFFKKIYENYEKINFHINKAFYQYDLNVNDCYSLYKLFLKIFIDSHQELNELYNNIDFDKQLKKSELVQNVVYKLPDKFTKDDVRKALIDVSDETINRELKQMQIEGKISAFGRGRSSMWLRLDHSKEKIKF